MVMIPFPVSNSNLLLVLGCLYTGVQNVGTAGTADTGKTTFGWTKCRGFNISIQTQIVLDQIQS